MIYVHQGFSVTLIAEVVLILFFSWNVMLCNAFNFDENKVAKNKTLYGLLGCGMHLDQRIFCRSLACSYCILCEAQLE